jgi:hypothetical protein
MCTVCIQMFVADIRMINRIPVRNPSEERPGVLRKGMEVQPIHYDSENLELSAPKSPSAY